MLRRLLALVGFLSLLCAGCGADAVDVHAVGGIAYEGRVERIETLGRYSSLEARLLLQLAGPPGKVVTDSDFYLYRFIYPTEGVDGGRTLVSGLVAVPASQQIRGIVSWQHGTNTYRPESISKPSLPEGLGIAALFAGAGFLTVAADYIGLGVSTQMHPYYHWPSTVSSVVDLLAIAEIIARELGDGQGSLDLFLAGFSQGGGATAALQRHLEENNPTGLRLRAAASIGGAFNLKEISFPHAIEQDDTFHLGYLLTAFSHVHGQPLDDIVRQPYRDLLPTWFDGTRDGEFLQDHLPGTLNELLTESFLESYWAGEEQPAWFFQALDAASTYDYAPRAPLRIYFGNRDSIVTPREAEEAFRHMRGSGGEVTLVDVGPYDHDQVVLAGLPAIQGWFLDLQMEGR